MRLSLLLRLLLISTFLFLPNTDYSRAEAEKATLDTSLQETDPACAGMLVNEVLFTPAVGNSEWVELKNTTAESVKAGGCLLSDGDGNWYQIPLNLPLVPPEGFVVVQFDGLGSGADETNMSDGLATLHSLPGMMDIFEEVDQVAFYAEGYRTFLPVMFQSKAIDSAPLNNSAELSEEALNYAVGTVLSYLAWGAAPGEQAEKAARAGLWEGSWFVGFSPGVGIEVPRDITGFSLGRLPGTTASNLDDWSTFQPDEVSPGTENITPRIWWQYPADGARIDSATFALNWNFANRAEGYHLQLAISDDFSDPLVDEVLSQPAYVPTEGVPEGVYYWRAAVVQAGSQSIWTSPRRVESRPVSLVLAGLSSSLQEVDSQSLAISWKPQRKDTAMLCLVGDSQSGDNPWNAAQIDMTEHSAGYSPQAALAMFASYYGSNLSQDRITYQIFNGTPEGDLGRHSALSTLELGNVINWATQTLLIPQAGKPAFEQIKTWINTGQPILVAAPGQARLISGYLEITENDLSIQYLRLLDSAARDRWVSYDDDEISTYWVGLPQSEGAAIIRKEEDLDADGIPDTQDDSDRDGVVDFDELHRFSGLNSAETDSDGDLLIDYFDLREYVYNSEGKYDWRYPDQDKDGLRKEVDADNDRDGSLDGCEDPNLNGIYELELGESDNFDIRSTRACAPIHTSQVYVSAGEFLMGCDPAHNTGLLCLDYELPQHAVYLDAFYINQYETTTADYAQCVAAGACTPPHSIYSNLGEVYYGHPDYADYPVIRVSWFDASNYCAWSGGRLLTEAEWEKAARSTDIRTFPWGDAPASCDLANTDLCLGGPTIIGSYPGGISPYGVFDMGGNVWEWVSDWYSSTYYRDSPYENPTGPSDEDCKDTICYKVVRGGGWSCQMSHMRTSYRYNYFHPLISSSYWGIRCGADLP